MNDLLVEFWHCNCGKPYRSQRATFQLLAAFLPNQSTDTASVNLLCDACNSIRSYNKTALGSPGMTDNSNSERYVYVQKIFLARISCADKTCECQIDIVVPATAHWTKRALTIRSGNWIPDATVMCRNDHPAAHPVRVVDLQRIYPGHDPMEEAATTKEIAFALLDRMEQLESERAALLTELELVRYGGNRQPDVKRIMSNDAQKEPFRLKNIELRRSIALAGDDNAALVMLKGLLEN
jgi:hypothetical protein